VYGDSKSYGSQFYILMRPSNEYTNLHFLVFYLCSIIMFRCWSRLSTNNSTHYVTQIAHVFFFFLCFFFFVVVSVIVVFLCYSILFLAFCFLFLSVFFIRLSSIDKIMRWICMYRRIFLLCQSHLTD